jgi:hypothetical protein
MNNYKEFKKLNRAVSDAIDVPLMDVKNIANMVMDYYPTPYYVRCLDYTIYDDDNKDAESGIIIKIYFLVSNGEEAWKLYNEYFDEHTETINSALPWSTITRLTQDEFIDNFYFVSSHPKYYLAKKEKIISVNVAVQDYADWDEVDGEYDDELWFDVPVYKYKNNEHKIIPF